MRIFAVALVAAIACAVAASAMAATFPPVIGFGTLPTVKATHSHSTKSCSVVILKSKSPVSNFVRKLRPVACEQPPRANTNIFNLAFVYSFKF